MTGQGEWLKTFDLGVLHTTSSLTTYTLVTCVLIIVPLIYDHQHRKALAEVEQRQGTCPGQEPGCTCVRLW